MNHRRRLIMLMLNMTTVSLIVAGVAIIFLYWAALEQQKERLREMTHIRAHLIAAMQRECQIEQPNSDCQQKILNVLSHAHSNFPKFDKTLEFTITKQQGEQIIFLLRNQDNSSILPAPISVNSNLGKPAQLALAGKSGTVIGLDYRGVKVVAAYEPIPSLKWGVVAKIDLHEINQPFINAVWYTLMVAVGVNIIGAVQFLRLSEPFIKELQASNQRYATLTEISPVAIFHADTEGNCIYANQKWCDITGLSQEETKGKGWIRAIYTEDRQRVQTEWENAVKNQAIFLSEHRLQNLEGKITWVIGQSSAEINAQGQVTGYLGILTDITPQKQAEQVRIAREKDLKVLTTFQQQLLNPHFESDYLSTLFEPVGQVLDANRVFYCQLHQNQAQQWQSEIMGQWCQQYVPLIRQNSPVIPFDGLIEQLIIGQTVVKYFSELSPEQQEFCQLLQIQSLLITPLKVQEQFYGYLAVTEPTAERVWSQLNIELLESMAISFALSLQRQQIQQELTNLNQELENRVLLSTEALRRELELITQIMETSPVGILVLTNKGLIIMANEQASRIFRISKDQLTHYYYNDSQWITTDFDGKILTEEQLVFKQVCATGKPVYDFRCAINHIGTEELSSEQNSLVITETKTTETLLISINAAPLFNEKKELTGVILTVEDITEQIKIEKSRQQLEAQFRTIFENAALGIALLNPQGYIIQSNQALQKMLGYSAEELSKLNFMDITYPDDLAQDVSNYQKLLEGKQDAFQIEKRYLHQDGGIIWGDLTVSVIRDSQSNVQFAIKIVQDITDRKQIQVFQTQLNHRYQSLVKALGEIVYEHIVSKDIIYWHGNYQKTLGYSSEEIGADGESWLNRVHPDDLPSVLAEFGRAFSEDKLYDLEYRFRHREGHYIWVLDRAVMFGEKDGEPEQVIGVLLDISKRKQTELELQSTKEQLEVILSGIADGISVLDKNGKLIYVNEPFAKRSGYRSPEEMLDKYQPKQLAEKYDLSDELGNILLPDNLPSQLALQGQTVSPMVVGFCPKNSNHQQWSIINSQPIFDEQGEVKLSVSVIHDITRIKQIEMALRESEERYQKMLETINQGIWIIDQEHQTTFVNEIMANMLGYTVPEMIGMSIFEFMEDESRTYCYQYLERRRQGITTENDLQFRRKNGKLIWVLISSNPIFDDFGHYQGALAIVTNISDRKRIETELQQQENQLNSILNTIQESLFLMSSEGIVLQANQTLVERLGTTYEELLGSCIYDFLPTEVAQRRRSYAQEVIRTGKQIRFEDVRNNRYFDNILYPILDDHGQVSSLVIFAQDITERKQAETGLKESEQRFRQLVENIEEVFWINSPDPTEVLYVSPAYETMFGRSCHSLLERGVSWLETVHPLDFDRVFLALEAMKTEHKFSQQYRIIRPDETVRWIFARTTSISNVDGQIIRYVGIAEDITERIEVIEALEKANQQLKDWGDMLQQQHHDRILLEKLTGFVQSCLNTEEAYQTLANLIEPLFPDCAGAVFMRDESGDYNEYMNMIASWGEIHSETNFSVNKCWSLRRGTAHIVTQDQPDLFCFHVQDNPLSAQTLCVPMMAQGEAIGLLYLEANQAGLLDESRQKLAHTLTEQLSLTLANLKLQEKLQIESVRDPLTGLFNRRYLEESLKREVFIASRKHYPVTIMMIDLDHFKDFNDTYTHALGDKILQALSQILQKHIRTSDIACRYGGEEFTVILPEVSLEEGKKRAEVFRTEIKKIAIKHHNELISGITASFGLAAFPEHGKTGEDVIHWADIALFDAKEQGRDRIIIA